MDTAELAELYIQRQAAVARRCQQLKNQLYRVDQAMLQWEEWEAEHERPPAQRRELPTPAMSYEALKMLRATLLEQFAGVTERTAAYRTDR